VRCLTRSPKPKEKQQQQQLQQLLLQGRPYRYALHIADNGQHVAFACSVFGT